MSITRVQANGKSITTANATGAPVAWGTTPTVGNLLIMVVSAYGTTASRTVSDSSVLSGGWTQVLDSPFQYWSTDSTAGIYWKIAGASETTPPSFTCSGTITWGIYTYEFSATHGWLSTPLDTYVHSATSTTAVTSKASGSTSTLLQTDELAIAILATDLSTVTAAAFTNSFTIDNPTTKNGSLNFAWKETAATTALSTTASWTTSSRAVSWIATFVPNTASAPASSTLAVKQSWFAQTTDFSAENSHSITCDNTGTGSAYPTAGNTLLALVHTAGAGEPTTVPPPSTWTRMASSYLSPSGWQGLDLFTFPVSSTGTSVSTTFTFSDVNSDAVCFGIWVLEIVGFGSFDAFLPAFNAATSNIGNTPSITGGGIASKAGELVIGWFYLNDASYTGIGPTGFTQQGTFFNHGGGGAFGGNGIVAVMNSLSTSTTLPAETLLWSTGGATENTGGVLISIAPPSGTLYTRGLSDAVATSDSIGRSQQAVRANTDAVSTSDVLGRAAAEKRSLSDAVATSDVLGRAYSAPRALTDAVSTSDALSRLFNHGRSLTDAVATSDALARLFTGARSFSDSLTTSDSVSSVYMAAPYSALVLGDGAIVYYRLDDTGTTAVNSGSGGATYNASIGSGFTKSVTGLLVGDSNTAIALTTASSFAGIDNQFRTTGLEFITNFSVEFLFNASVLTSGSILCGYNNGASGWGWQFIYSGTSLSINVGVSSISFTPSTSTTYHVVFTYNGTTGILYVNGSSVGSTTMSAPTYSVGSRLDPFGYGAAFYGPTLEATMDEFALYGSVLTSTQVITHYSKAFGFTTHFATLSDAVATSDILTRLFTGTRANTQVMSTADSLGRVFNAPRSLSDAVSTSDALARSYKANRSESDATATSDTLARHFTGGRSLADAVATSDVLGRVFAAVRSLTNASSTSDSLGRAFTGARTLTDATATSDSIGRMLASVRAASDSLSTSDVLARLFTGGRILSDALATSDSAIGLKVTIRGASDAVSTSDILSRGFTGSRALNDSLTTSDGLARLGTFARTLADATATSDSIARLSVLHRSMSEALGNLIDSLTRAVTFHRAESDSFTTSDSVQRIVTYNRALSDLLATIADSIVSGRAIIRGLSDSLTTADSIISHQELVRSLADASTLTDSLHRMLSSLRSCSDVLSTSDNAGVKKAIARIIADVVATTDELGMMQSLFRKESDVLSVTDTLAAHRELVRAAVDSLTTIAEAVAIILAGLPIGTLDLSIFTGGNLLLDIAVAGNLSLPIASSGTLLLDVPSSGVLALDVFNTGILAMPVLRKEP